ncbi:hypothetical protein E5676_scaffold108G001570 [Cucumis melo var. makuwa]|uniref:Uncharacterized protein n=1 Tax=Cucumis melo var. makuwa TaxID=1194695 RepID=A0A5D3C1U5_CUCMM|nr:hypothetical protein E6C27_scaffold44G004550 [Cucumis melo var. makuwa]TYK05330.1 hypothetical protein E5676_scaffold108G001570 [Cucumis melo var. makuwa]
MSPPQACCRILAPSLDSHHPFATRAAPSAAVNPCFRPKQETRAFDPEPDPRSRSAPSSRARVHQQAEPRLPSVASQAACAHNLHRAEPVPFFLAEPPSLLRDLIFCPSPSVSGKFWNTVDQLTWSIGFLQQGQALQPRPRDLAAWKAHFLAVRTRRTNLQVLPWDTEDQIFVPMGAHVARVRKRARDWVEAEVGAKASWRATRSDRGEP